MQSRTQLRQLALVNWRGVLYGEYEFDDHVTALEGANGAGKTTVMIGAYVALLPDLNLLKFTNLGETDATGGDRGIWGRLGHPGPAYSALDFSCGKQGRLVAGVWLDRKAEPRLELTTFVIEGLDDDVPLRDLFLLTDDGQAIVREFDEIQQRAGVLGGEFEKFTSRRAYFSRLFDYGVLPMRLAAADDRQKLNELLKTSMTGGISSALQSGLRDFLLKEESRLGNLVHRMESNLDACRTTRRNVEQSRKLHDTIQQVSKHGAEMFEAAVFAARNRERERRATLNDREQHFAAAQSDATRHREAVAQIEKEHAEAEQAVQDLKSALGRETSRLDQLKQAHKLDAAIRSLDARQSRVADEHTEATHLRTEAQTKVADARNRYRQLQGQATESAEQLSDHQEAYDDIARKVALWSRAQRTLSQVRTQLEQPNLDEGHLIPTRTRLARDHQDLVEQAASLTTDLETAEARRRTYQATLNALQHLESEPGGGSPLNRALTVLREMRAMESEAERAEELKAERDERWHELERQRLVRATARGLATERLPLDSSEAVREALTAVDANLEAARDTHQELHTRIELASRDADALTARVEELQALRPRWQAVTKRARRLETRHDRTLRKADELARLKRELQRVHDTTHANLQAARQQVDVLREELEQLQFAGGHFDRQLLSARDLVDGTLLAELMDDTPVDEAPRIQALLGPLHQAIVVDDATSAAERLAASAECPDTVWLIDEDGFLHDLHGRDAETRWREHVFVRQASHHRLTRFPQRPVIGRAAREQRIADLESQHQQARERSDELASEFAGLKRDLEEIAHLERAGDLLFRADPQIELRRAEADLQALRDDLAAWTSRRDRAAEDVKHHNALRSTLEELLPDATLLGPPDLDPVVTRLSRRLEDARAYRQRLQEVADHRTTLQDGLDQLRNPPPSEEQMRAIRAERDELKRQAKQMLLVLDQLDYLVEHVEHLAWAHWKPVLDEQEVLGQKLRSQLDQTQADLAALEQTQQALEGELDTCRKEESRLAGTLEELVERLGERRTERAQLPVEDASDEALRTQRNAVAAAESQLQQADARERALAAEQASARTELKHAEKAVQTASSEVDKARQNLEPWERQWTQLRALARQHDLLDAVLNNPSDEDAETKPGATLSTDAKEARAALLATLRAVDDGADLLSALENEQIGAGEQSAAEGHLRAWLQVRRWLRRRVPPQISQSPDPVVALREFESHLARLQERLVDKERMLRQDATHIANSLWSEIRKARNRVRKLNDDLRDIGFGSIRGVRIDAERRQSMTDLLHALQNQSELFHQDMPVEQAMEELFRQVGGGRINADRLLDYREYLSIVVRVKRVASDEWEVARSSRLSTGEAIGVGASVMMVVLKSWEASTRMFRKKGAPPILRFLFLDEANRLDKDNLEILFDLCERLDMQLLIAAPEVARTGATVYRLVRTENAQGQEVVRVTGRRQRDEAAA